MSFVSLLPYGRTIDYWWERLEGRPERRWFMVLKLLEVAAFVGNSTHNARQVRGACDIDLALARTPMLWPQQAKLAVVVPMFTRTPRDEAMAHRIVRRLSEQTHRPEVVVVVDDASPRVVELAGVQVVRLPRNAGPANARNIGIEHALAHQPDAVVLTDLDCIPDPAWLASVATGFGQEPAAAMLSGRTDSFDRSSLGTYHDINGTLNGRSRDEGLLYGPTCNLAVRAEVLDDLRFDPNFPLAAAEDIDFCLRALMAGWRISHCSEMVVLHDYGFDGLSRPEKLRRFWRQFRRYAQGERTLLRRHPGYGRLFEGTREITSDAWM